MTHVNELPLTLTVVTSEKTFPDVKCDSILLTVKDNENGKGGGAYGIRRGHAKALIATADGTVTASAGGEKVFSVHLSEGFASIDKNHIIITANQNLSAC